MGSGRENNFNILKFVAAFMVIAGHMAYISGGELPILLGQGVQTIGVKIFFLIGGYLICKSWMSDPDIIRYAVRRALRIIPALACYVIIAILVSGFFLTTLSAKEFFTHPSTWNYLKNIGLHTEYFLPGVFADNPYPDAVNGSLWTLPVEVFMYCMVPVILSIFGINKKTNKSRNGIIYITIVVCIIQIVHLKCFPEWRYVVYGTDVAQAMSLIPYYLIGVMFALIDFRKKMYLQFAAVFMLFLSCFGFDPVYMELFMYIWLPYFVFSFSIGEKPLFAKLFQKNEISYGIYLYGFFVQQTVVLIFKKWGVGLNQSFLLVLCMIITCLIALGSYHGIEKPAQILSKKIIRILQNRER
ncbi:MAG: acyltransferase [Lachnospiraceae bacterium]|nr:acyltransferase [Lachnospiraceae bacterium]